MALEDLVIRSQLIPPRQRKTVLHRPRLEARLKQVLEYPLTVVQAGTGYGKSTALATLASWIERTCWYTITEPDRDPLLFLAHLICAFERQDPAWCEPALRALEGSGGRVTLGALTPLLNTLTLELEEEFVLVLDDYHLVSDVPDVGALVERLVDYVPPRLHVVVSSRQMPPLEALTRWRAKGRVLIISRAELAFTEDEIEALYREQYGYPLSLEQAQALVAETEGWAIALQMVWQGLHSGAVPDLDAILGRLPSTLEALFDYLAQDVLAQQPPPVQRFLLNTSVLRQMDGPACDHLLASQDSASTLQRLQEAGLFLVAMGEDVFRYHRLFHDFLQAQQGHGDKLTRGLHRRAAEYYRQVGQPEETVYHLLQAQHHAQAAESIEEIGTQLVAMGRFDSLSTWIACLPPDVRAARPSLQLLMGDIARLTARFDEALDHYISAEGQYAVLRDRVGRSRALRGQAQVYLDTVRPLKADSLLEEALRLLDPEEHRHETAALLDHLAENKLNLGYPDEAQALHHEARLLRSDSDPGDLYLEARALVRTGRLADARRLLEQRAAEERQADESRPQRFHRETVLLLSLVHALQGNAEAAEDCAREGIAIGKRLHSAFVEAVGYVRLGHAVQVGRPDPWHDASRRGPLAAAEHYHHAIEQIRAFRVMRTQVEPLWGLCHASIGSGDLAQAERHARQALDIARRAGDEWICHLIQQTLGAGYARLGQLERALEQLSEAATGFAQVGDSFGQSAAQLWLALATWKQGDADQAMEHFSRLLALILQHGHDLLLTRCTFMGLSDDQAALPLLIEAHKRGMESTYVGRVLEGMGIRDVDYHPGYTLSVRTLGRFAVWRGSQPVIARDWTRAKARQIFQLLLTYRGNWFYREQIVDQLWPHLPPDAAERDFKVALNALNKALEPDRPRGAPPFLVARRRSVYGLNPAARVAVDADRFEELAASDDIDSLRQALDLYQDDYLPESLYDDWPSAERQRLRHLYLVTAERLARHLIRDERWDQVVGVCHAILARDNCWEAAYRLLMQAYAAQGNRPQVQGIYQRCVATLREELDVEPSPTTRTLFERLVQPGDSPSTA
jgi:ATP/maltotriose-dependent transcriptional regulator MalT/DNA-binding SARP family transcriptional activator